MPVSQSLLIEGQLRPVRRAELEIQRIAHHPIREDDQGFAMSLALYTDDELGEDGGLEPTIQSIPLREALGRWPRLDELPGLVVAVPRDEAWDAWLGNDNEPLGTNQLEFGRWSGHEIGVRWSASWSRGARRPRGTLVFEGKVAFIGIKLHLDETESLDALITRIWGPGAAAHFQITRLPSIPRRADPALARVMPSVSYALWPKFLGPRVE